MIVLADKPRQKSRRDIGEIMQKLVKEQGCTILLVTHDNRIFEMKDGEPKTDGI